MIIIQHLFSGPTSKNPKEVDYLLSLDFRASYTQGVKPLSSERESSDLPDTHRAAALWRWSVYSPCLNAQSGEPQVHRCSSVQRLLDMPDMKYRHNRMAKPKRRSGVGLPRGPLVPIIMAAFHRFLHCEGQPLRQWAGAGVQHHAKPYQPPLVPLYGQRLSRRSGYAVRGEFLSWTNRCFGVGQV